MGVLSDLIIARLRLTDLDSKCPSWSQVQPSARGLLLCREQFDYVHLRLATLLNQTGRFTVCT